MFVQFFTSQKGTFPDRPIKLVVPYDVDSHGHRLALTFAKEMEVVLQKAVRLEHAGPTYTAWLDSLQTAGTDGHTLLWHSGESTDDSYIGGFDVVDHVV